MATPKKEKPPETPGYNTTEAIAGLIGVTPRWVRELTTQGVLVRHKVPAGERYNVIESVKAYCQYLRDKLANRESKLTPNEQEKKKLDADIRIKEAKAALLELQQNELEGKMHRAEDLQEYITDLVFTIRGALIALPGRVAVDVVATKTAAEASHIIRAEVYRILEELSNYKYDPDYYAERVRDREGWSEFMNDENDEETADS